MLTARQVAERLDADVDGKQEVACGDQLLRKTFRPLRAATVAAEQPNDHATRCELDQRVDPETHQGDTPRNDSGGDRDRELDYVPGVPGPGELLHPPLKLSPLP